MKETQIPSAKYTEYLSHLLNKKSLIYSIDKKYELFNNILPQIA